MGCTDTNLMQFFQANNRYSLEIPKYQRGYSWTSDQITEFWDDLINVDRDSSKSHFFGTVYVSSKNSVNPHTIRIVDGQQRITTVAIFLICVRDYFYWLGNTVSGAEELFKRTQEMLYGFDPLTLKPDINKFVLTLSRTNKDFFNDYVVPVVSAEKQSDKLQLKIKAQNTSNECIADAYVKFFNLIKLTFSHENDVAKINHLVWTLIAQFNLYRIEVQDDAHAYYMFNLINNRGLQLAESDLVKNEIFGRLDKEFTSSQDFERQMDDYDRKWAEIQDNITGQDNGNDKLDNFFQQYLIAFKLEHNRTNLSHTNYTVKRKNVYDTFQKLLDAEQASVVINDLLEWSGKFLNLRKPESEFSGYPDAEHYLKKIASINAVNVYSVLMAGYRSYWENGNKYSFVKLTELCFKYHLRAKSLRVGINLEAYEQMLGEIAHMIKNEPPVLIQDIISRISAVEEAYPSNAKIKPHLDELKPANNNLAAAYLAEIERTYDLDKTSKSDVSVEHIMPKNLKYWSQYIKDNHSDIKTQDDVKAMHSKYIDLLGNRTLLRGPKNKKLANKNFDFKKEIYAEDTHVITNQLKDIKIWTKTKIEKRQQKFSNMLSKILDLKTLHD